MNDGWIKIHRKMLDHEIWQNSNYFCVWMYLLMHANHQQRRMLWNGKKIDIPRGGGIVSQKKIAQHFGIGRATVRRAFDYFIGEQMVVIKTTNKFSYFTIQNYDKYQASDTKRTPSGHQADTNKNGKNDKKQTNGNFSKTYPQPQDKRTVSKATVSEPNRITRVDEFIVEHERRKAEGWIATYGIDLVCISRGQVRLKIHDGNFVDFNDSLTKVIWKKKS